MTLYRALSVYLSGRPGIEAGTEAQKTARVRTEVLLLSIEALPALWRLRSPVI